jgi:hypothetical protein
MQIKAKDGTEDECVSPNVIYTGGGDDAAVVGLNLPPNVLCVIPI